MSVCFLYVWLSAELVVGIIRRQEADGELDVCRHLLQFM